MKSSWLVRIIRALDYPPTGWVSTIQIMDLSGIQIMTVCLTLQPSSSQQIQKWKVLFLKSFKQPMFGTPVLQQQLKLLD